MGRQPCCDKVGLKKGPWTAEEDKKLINFILIHGQCCWRAVPKLAGLKFFIYFELCHHILERERERERFCKLVKFSFSFFKGRGVGVPYILLTILKFHNFFLFCFLKPGFFLIHHLSFWCIFLIFLVIFHRKMKQGGSVFFSLFFCIFSLGKGKWAKQINQQK